MSIVGSKVDGSVAVFVWGGGGASALDKELDQAEVATESGKVDGGTSHVILEGGVSPSLDQELGTLFKTIGNLCVLWGRMVN